MGSNTEKTKPQISNTAKTLKNSVISVFAQIVSFLLVFVNRKIFLMFLDIEYLGYQSLFGNVFTLLSVAELGLGQVITFHLYREVVQKNEDEMGRLMTVYKYVYRIVALTVLVIGGGCYFLLPYIIKGSTLEWWYISVIYFLQLGSIIASYFLSYRRVIYRVSQKEYVCVRIDMFVHIGIQILQLVFLALFKNYLLYLVINLSTGVIENVIIALKSNRDYPFLKKRYAISRAYLKTKNFFQDVKNMIVHRVAYAVYSGTDNIVISAFLSVSYVGMYGNYYTLHTSVVTLFVRKIMTPVQATLGNIVYSDRSLEKQWEQFKVFDVFSFFYASLISLGFFVFYQPTIELWLGKQYLLPFSFVIMFTITIYLGLVWEIVYRYRSVFGDFKQDKWLMVASAVLNIGISILGVHYWGITGIQVGTLVAFLPIAHGRIRFVVKNYFHQSMWLYYLKHLVLFGVVAGEGAICYFLTRWMPVNIPYYLLRGVVWFFVPLAINVLIYFRSPYFKRLMKYFGTVFGIVTEKFRRKRKVAVPAQGPIDAQPVNISDETVSEIVSDTTVTETIEEKTENEGENQ